MERCRECNGDRRVLEGSEKEFLISRIIDTLNAQLHKIKEVFILC